MFDVIHQDKGFSRIQEQMYRETIDRKNEELRNSVSVEGMKNALSIAREFKKNLVFDIYTADNSLAEFAVWREPQNPFEYMTSFRLNGKRYSFAIPQLKLEYSVKQAVREFSTAVAEAVSTEILTMICETKVNMEARHDTD